MGRVRPVFIKKVAKELIVKYPDVFNDDFDENKILLSKYTLIQSKSVRNRIAGYLVHLVKNK